MPLEALRNRAAVVLPTALRPSKQTMVMRLSEWPNDCVSAAAAARLA